MPKFPHRRPAEPRRQGGVSMVEVMVSCLVLSAGVAAISALQTRAIFNSMDAQLQGYAAQARLSFDESMLVTPNEDIPVPSDCRDGAYVGVYARGSAEAYVTNLLSGRCPNSLNVFSGALDSFLPYNRSCNLPSRSTRNIYCQTDRILIDFRQPVWVN